MAAVAIVGALVGGAMTAIGQIRQGQAQAAAAEQNARIADYNRAVADRNRGITLGQSNADALDSQRELTRNLSTIRAAYGANGLALEGSPTDVIADTALEKSYDTTKIRYKGDVQAAGYTDEANNYTLKSQLARQEAESAPTNALFSAAGTFFGSVGRAAGAMK